MSQIVLPGGARRHIMPPRNEMTIGGRGGSGGSGSPLSFATGTITIPTSTGQQATVVGFRPKLVILWGYSSALDSDLADGFEFPFGAASGTGNQFCQSSSSQDAVTSNSASRLASKIYTVQHWTSATAPVAVANLISFDATGFTLDWTTAPAATRYCFYLAIGGGPAAAAFSVVQWQMPAALGNVSVTGAGFAPTAAIHVGTVATLDAGNAAASFNLGAMTATAQWAAAMNQSDGAAIPDSARYFRADRALHMVASNTGADHFARFVSLDADGFTLDVDDAPAATREYFSICMKGVNVAVGATAKPTGAAPATLTISGLSFTPKALLFATANVAAAGAETGTAPGSFSIGVATALAAQRGATLQAYDAGGVESNQGARRMNTTGVGNLISVTDGVVTVAGAFTGFTADGATVVYDPNDATAYGIGYLAIG
jgi:hypothetical protein